MTGSDSPTRVAPLLRYFLRLGCLGFGGPVATAIAALYAHLGGLRLVTAIFYGVSPAVIVLRVMAPTDVALPTK